MARLFGTDGIRGIANKELTPQMAFNLGQAGAYILGKNRAKGQEKPKIVIGKDTRISGDMLEAALTAGICSMGVDVFKVGVLPTPGIAYLTRNLGAEAGVVISASHNPYEDNGIKFFSGSGFKLPDELEDEIENTIKILDTLPLPCGSELGQVLTVENPENRYCEFLIEHAVNLSGLKVVLDCANGAASVIGPRVFRELGAEVIALYNQPNGTNINVQCGSTHPESLAHKVLEHKADVWLALDGDADRIIAVDETGGIIDGDFIMAICALALKEKGKLKNNALAVTVMSNMGLHKALKKAGIEIFETKVGDRYVLEKLLETKAVLGGEQSGHIIFLEHNTTGDGLFSALQLLSVLQEKKEKLSVLASQMQRYPQVLVNCKVKDKDRIMHSPQVLAEIDQVQNHLGDNGRVLVRPSGTESLIRIMLEGQNEDELHELAGKILAAVKSVEAS
jgi:phosphoglucosamine mutase